MHPKKSVKILRIRPFSPMRILCTKFKAILTGDQTFSLANTVLQNPQIKFEYQVARAPYVPLLVERISLCGYEGRAATFTLLSLTSHQLWRISNVHLWPSSSMLQDSCYHITLNLSHNYNMTLFSTHFDGGSSRSYQSCLGTRLICRFWDKGLGSTQ